MKQDRGKRYTGIQTLARLRRRGFAVVEVGTFWETGPTVYWHRSEDQARNRVRRLRSRACTSYLVPLATVAIAGEK